MNTSRSDVLLHGELTDRIIKVFYETYNELGHGFLESIYANSLCHSLRDAGIAFEAQVPITVLFRGATVGDFRLDFVVGRRVVVEVKAISTFPPAHDAQLLNYLKATGLTVGLLLNFGPRAEFRRRVFESSRHAQ